MTQPKENPTNENKMGSLNTEILTKFAELDTRKSELNHELSKINKELAKLDELVQEQLIQNDVGKISINGRTIFVRERIVAVFPEGPQEAIKALKDAGLSRYVAENFNRSSVNAYIGELTRNGEPLPEEFRGRIKSDSIFKATSVKSSG